MTKTTPKIKPFLHLIADQPLLAARPEFVQALLHLEAAAEDLDEARAPPRRQMKSERGVASIPVMGYLMPTDSRFLRYVGGTALENVARDLSTALADKEVREIVLHIDSGGGSPHGLPGFTAMAREAARQKPLYAFIGGMGCSAAYWVACGASRIVIEPTAILGSIGVLMATAKQIEPDMYGEMGVTITSSNAPNKSPDPTTDAGSAELRAALDEIERLFLQDVAAARGLAPEAVATQFGQGGVRVGKAAAALGMADAVQSYASFMAERRAVTSAGAAAGSVSLGRARAEFAALQLAQLRQIRH